MSHTPHPQHRPLWRGRALILASILLSAFNLRTAVTSLTPLLSALEDVFGFGSTMTGVLGMVPTAAFALFGALTPALAHRLSLERTALLSMCLAAAGLLFRSAAGDAWGLLAGSAIALAGMGIGNVVLPPLVKRYFPDRVGTVSTLYITALQLGTMLPALAAVPLADAAGWRISLGIWSLMATTAALSWLSVLVSGRHRDSLPAPSHTPSTAAAPMTRGRVWRSPVAWGMTFMFGMTSLITYSMFTWLPKLLVEAGASPAFGGNMVALFSALGLIGALTIPALAVRITNPFPLVFACALSYLCAFAGLLLAPMKWPVLWIVLLGLGPSTFPLSLTLINLRTRSAAGSAALSGFMQGLGYTLSCLGPLMFGWLHAATQGWQWPFTFLVLCLLLLLTGGYLACRPRMLEDTW